MPALVPLVLQAFPTGRAQERKSHLRLAVVPHSLAGQSIRIHDVDR